MNLPVPHSREALVAGAQIQALVPTTFEAVQRQALAIHDSGCAPKGVKKASDVTVLILAGLELGLPPMQSIQALTIINGRIGVFGKLGLALVRKSPVCEYIKEWFEGEPYADNFTAVCESKRKGAPEPVVTRFSVADAKEAGLWQEAATVDRWVWEPNPQNPDKNHRVFKKGVPNDAPWYRFKKRMLQMRSRGFNLDDNFGDVTRGFPLVENLDEDIQPQQQRSIGAPPAIPAEEVADVEHTELAAPADTPTTAQPATAAGPGHQDSTLETGTPAATGGDEEARPELSPVEWLDALEDELRAAKTVEAVEEAYAALDIEAGLEGVPNGVETARGLRDARIDALEAEADRLAREGQGEAPAENEGLLLDEAESPPAAAAVDPWALPKEGWLAGDYEALDPDDQVKARATANTRFKLQWSAIIAQVTTPATANRAETLWRDSKRLREHSLIDVSTRLEVKSKLNDAIDAQRG